MADNSTLISFYFVQFSSDLDIIMTTIEELALIVASWVIRARRREIKRFVLEFKAKYFFLNSLFDAFSLKRVT